MHNSFFSEEYPIVGVSSGRPPEPNEGGMKHHRYPYYYLKGTCNDYLIDSRAEAYSSFIGWDRIVGREKNRNFLLSGPNPAQARQFLKKRSGIIVHLHRYRVTLILNPIPSAGLPKPKLRNETTLQSSCALLF